MPSEKNWAITEDLTSGFLAKRDFTQVPPGGLILGSQNVEINDGDRVSAVGGYELFGAANNTNTPIKSLFTYALPNGTEIPIRSRGTVLEYYSPDTLAWENLNDGYTSGKIFGFAALNQTDSVLPELCLCNGVEPYSTWTGQTTQLNGALSGGEATITVDSVLTDFVYYSGTASSVTTTTIDITASDWAADVWNDLFYVRITSGAQSGKISKISDGTATQITFSAISGLSGTPTFEIRRVKFEDATNRVLRIGTTDVTYTGFGSDTTFTGCSGTPAASDDAAVTQALEKHPGNERGNILAVLNSRVFMAGIEKNPDTIYFSAIGDGTNFSTSSPRTAGEGGYIPVAFGGGRITGLGVKEDALYILKKDAVHSVVFSGTDALSSTAVDGNDIPSLKPLIQSPNVGANNAKAVIPVDNEMYYVAPDAAVKDVSRVAEINYVQAQQLSDPIVGYVKNLTVSEDACGIFFNQKAYVAMRTSDSSTNNVVLPFNFNVVDINGTRGAWEPPMDVAANCFTIYNNELIFGSSVTSETYKLFPSGVFDRNGTGYTSRARFAYNNYLNRGMPKVFTRLFVEGYISENTTITVKIRYNYLGGAGVKEAEISGTDDDIVIASQDFNVLGVFGLGLEPLAGIVSEDDTLTDLRKFRVYLSTKETRFYEMSVEFSTTGQGKQWEILSFGTNAAVVETPNKSIKKLLG